jgi:serine/threonine protein kinase
MSKFQPGSDSRPSVWQSNPKFHKLSPPGKLTEKVDVWASGCILNEIFAGKLPFEECTQIQHIVKKLLIDKQGPFVPQHLSSSLKSLINDCLRFDLRERITADEIHNRLVGIKDRTKPMPLF